MKHRLKKTTPFVVSLTLHLVAAILLSFNLSGNGDSSSDQEQGGGPIEVEMVSEEKGTQPEGQNDEVVPKQAEVEEEIVETPPPEPEEITIPEPEKPKPIEGVTECENDMWFGGIGIQQDWQTGEIQEVYSGYPADKNGLRRGDIINLVNGERKDRIRGEPGTTITIGIFRPSTNEHLTFTFKRDKICLGKKI